MNRFYKPTPREYVSTHVDMPWEFLQGVAEQKQKGYDTATAGADATASLLNFNVIPGDTSWKQEKQKQYNDKLYKVRDQLMQTGDYTGASRELANVTREINQDQDLAIMKAAVAPYEKDRDAFEKMQQEGKLRNQWQSNFRTDYSTRDEKTGRHKSYNQFVGYAAPDYHKAATDSFGKLELSTDEKGRTYFIDSLGIKRDVTQSGGAILQKDIISRAQTALPAYRNTDAYHDHTVRAAWELKNNLNPELKKLAEEQGESQAISARADELSRQNMISTNLDQIKHQSKDIIKDDLYSEDNRKARGLKSLETPYGDGSFGPSIPVKKGTQISPNVYSTTPTKTISPAGVLPILPGEQKTTYHSPASLPKDQQEMFWSYVKTYKPEMFKKHEAALKTGKLDSTEVQKDLGDVYTGFSAMYNAANLGMAKDVVEYSIKDADKLHESITGVKGKDVTMYDLLYGEGMSKDLPLYDWENQEFTTIGEIAPKESSGKNIKVNINKKYDAKNSFTLNAEMEGVKEPDRFADAYSVTIGDKSYIMCNPKNTSEEVRKSKEVNAVHKAQFRPNTPVETKINGNTFYTVFTPIDLKTQSIMTPENYTNALNSDAKQFIPGLYHIYKTKEAALDPRSHQDDLIIDYSNNNGEIDLNSDEGKYAFAMAQHPEQVVNGVKQWLTSNNK